jgi:hypothetical protein
MAAEILAQHPDWVGTFLTAVVIPLLLGGVILTMFWLDNQNEAKPKRN